MRYFLDTEFAETGRSDRPTIDLISIALVREDGREYYAESSEFLVEHCNPWVKENVLPLLGYPHWRKKRSEIRDDIVAFIADDEEPQFWTFYGDYDWVVFCWLFGDMVDLPMSFPRYAMDLRQWWSHLGEPPIKPPHSTKEHNALVDAHWNLSFYEALKEYESREDQNIQQD